MLLKQLLKDGAVKGEVVALDSTAIKAYSQRSLDNKTGKSDREVVLEEEEEASYLAIRCIRRVAQALSCP
jgi:hypothetical protein